MDKERTATMMLNIRVVKSFVIKTEKPCGIMFPLI